MTVTETSEILTLLTGAAAITGLPLDDPHLEAEAAKLAVAIERARYLRVWHKLLHNTPTDNDPSQFKRRCYVARITSVSRDRTSTREGGTWAGKAKIETQAERDGAWRADKPMWTDGLDDPIALECMWRCNAMKGKGDVLIYRHNEPAKAGTTTTNADGETVSITGYRRIIWVDPLSDTAREALAKAEEARAAKGGRAAIPGPEPTPRRQAQPERPAPAEEAPAAPKAKLVNASAFYEALTGQDRQRVDREFGQPHGITDYRTLTEEQAAELRTVKARIEADHQATAAAAAEAAQEPPAALPLGPAPESGDEPSGRPVSLLPLLRPLSADERSRASDWAAAKGISMGRATPSQAAEFEAFVATFNAAPAAAAGPAPDAVAVANIQAARQAMTRNEARDRLGV